MTLRRVNVTFVCHVAERLGVRCGLDGRVLFTVVDTSPKPQAVLANPGFLVAPLLSFALSVRCQRLNKKNVPFSGSVC